MDESTILELGSRTLMTALIIVTPALLTGMVIGLAVSLFQTITALQEQTLSSVPKMIAVVGLLIFLMPWILDTLRSFAVGLFRFLPELSPPGLV